MRGLNGFSDWATNQIDVPEGTGEAQVLFEISYSLPYLLMIISDTFSSIASTPYMQVICKFTYTFLLPIEKALILIKEDITTVA